MKPLMALFALLVACSTAHAGDSLQLVGEARLKVLFWSVYNSRLYAPDGLYSADKRPLRLEIEYLRNIDADDLVDRTALEWRQQGKTHQRQPQWLQALSQLWPDVGENDVLALELDETDRSTFYINGALLGRIEDAEFGRHFLDIWLSPETSQPELRSALIGAALN